MAAAAIMGVGLGLQAFGNYQASRAESAALKEQAQQATVNAMSARQKAEADAEMQSIQSRQAISQQTADFAAAGLDGGSVYATMADSMRNAELDRLSILYGGDVRSKNFMTEAESKIRGARNINQAGVFGLLAGGFQAAGKFASKGKNAED